VQKTTIELADETADELYQRKGRGQTYDEYVRELLRRADNGEQADADEYRVEEGRE